MSGGDWVVLLTAVGVILAGIGVIFGIPTWRLQRHALAQQKERDEQAKLSQLILQALAGDHAEEPRSVEHPSILDALKDLRNLMSDIAELQAVQGWHMSDGHGPDMTEVFKRGYPRAMGRHD